MNIAIIGTGYVGLVAGACFARKYDVVCVDIDAWKVDSINDGESPFYESGLDIVLDDSLHSGRLRATTDIFDAISASDLVFICVGTPSLHSGAIDLSFVESAAVDIGKVLADIDDYKIIIQRSTVVPTTTRDLVGGIIERTSGKSVGRDFGIAFVPEFLREGNAVDDFLNPDRVIIGTDDKNVANILGELYRDFYPELPDDNILFMSSESAELVKYASNSFLATKISFANEIASLAELISGVDVIDVMRGVGFDHRISPKYFGAGAGFGGSCFPKDIKALIDFARTKRFEPLLLESVIKRNEFQAMHIVDLVEDAVHSLKDSKIAILGLSFKPNTSDMREAPSLRIIAELIERGAGQIIGCDPQSIDDARKILGNRIRYTLNPNDALKDANIAIVLTEWDEFEKLTPADFIENMATPVVLDARRIYDCEEFSKVLKYIAIGKRIID
ncbi:UDP-glucose/GDP-mannose dehydrogenase family protein [bacterium]|nr:UDP-glucose/GDP-mannose dehydrogenase family protein [bacterium]